MAPQKSFWLIDCLTDWLSTKCKQWCFASQTLVGSTLKSATKAESKEKSAPKTRTVSWSAVLLDTHKMMSLAKSTLLSLCLPKIKSRSNRSCEVVTAALARWLRNITARGRWQSTSAASHKPAAAYRGMNESRQICRRRAVSRIQAWCCGVQIRQYYAVIRVTYRRRATHLSHVTDAVAMRVDAEARLSRIPTACWNCN